MDSQILQLDYEVKNWKRNAQDCTYSTRMENSGSPLANATQGYHVIQMFRNEEQFYKVNNPAYNEIIESENLKISKSKLSTALYVGIFSALLTASFIGLPTPFNYVSSVAFAGPLAASLLLLRR